MRLRASNYEKYAQSTTQTVIILLVSRIFQGNHRQNADQRAGQSTSSRPLKSTPSAPEAQTGSKGIKIDHSEGLFGAVPKIKDLEVSESLRASEPPSLQASEPLASIRASAGSAKRLQFGSPARVALLETDGHAEITVSKKPYLSLLRTPTAQNVDLP